MDARKLHIDALRGFAILFVIQYHFLFQRGVYETLGLPEPIVKVLGIGWAGVDIFFVLSAFLLTNNLLRHFGEPRVIGTFYLRRALRILPLFWLLLIAGFSLEAIYRPSHPTAFFWLWSDHLSPTTYLLFFQNWVEGWGGTNVANFYSPTWSLAVEEQFYLVLPILATWLSRLSLGLLATTAIVFTPVLRAIVQSEVNHLAAYTWTITRFDSFGWGILLALVRAAKPDLFRHPPWKLLAASIACLALLVLYEEQPITVTSDTTNFAITLIAFTAMTLTVVALTGAPVKSRLLQPAYGALVWCGRRCYSLYLMHMPVLGLFFLWFGLRDPAVNNELGIALVIGACILLWGLVELAYRWIELPLMALAEKVASYAPQRRPLHDSNILSPESQGVPLLLRSRHQQV